MTVRQLIVSVPGEVAEELVASGEAFEPKRVRGVDIADVVSLAVTASQAGSVAVALAQTPAVVEDLAQRLRSWNRSRNPHLRGLTMVDIRQPDGAMNSIVLEDVETNDIFRVLLELEQISVEEE